jgi:hypothetical protein
VILALLLQMVLFKGYAQEAAARVGVPLVTVEEVHITQERARLLAWVWNCYRPADPGCGRPVVYVGDDVLRTAPPQVLRYLAYHEVCHLKLGHHLAPVPPDAHSLVRGCLYRALGSSELILLEGWYNSYSQRMFVYRSYTLPSR